MEKTLAAAIMFINLAALFYTIGVWAEKRQKVLKIWHVVVFWLGFACDTVGTAAMSEIAGVLFQLTFHGVTGAIALLLMFFHAVWATWVILAHNERLKTKFHKFSVFVWLVWLIPMVSGFILRL